ncbi:MAG: CMP-binding protein, partial [Clostridia bacterium]|nr:CMP-binding protein [Clostridia bacterium]
MNFTPVDNNGLVDGFCLVKSVDIKTSSKGDTYLDMTLGDNDGEINAKLWRYSKEVQGEYEANQIIKVRGTITQYNGSDQLRVEKIRLATKSDGVKIDDFVQSADYTGEQMYNELICIVDSFKDEDLKRLVKKIYEDNRLCMLYW